MAELTPMMQQYLDIKAKNPDSILFFRLGDFYEMFNDDAKLVSKELDLTLTTRDRNKPPEERTPMCGVPYHSCDSYIARLIAKGYKVAICEQTEDPALAKGLVEREIIRVVTPGTVINESLLMEGENNFLASLWVGDDGVGLCFGDVSTGEVFLTGYPLEGWQEHPVNELARFAPHEILLSPEAQDKKLLDYIVNNTGCRVEQAEEARFALEAATGGKNTILLDDTGMPSVMGRIPAFRWWRSYGVPLRDPDDRPLLHEYPPLLFLRPLFRAGPRGPAKSGAPHHPPGQGKEGLPAVGSG